MAEEVIPDDIAATAYVTNESRARRMDMSRDRYARAWIPRRLRSQVRALWDRYAADVYPYDDIELAVRNRFFLDHLEEASKQRELILLNLGSGFTSYPFLITKPQCWHRFIEVDLPQVTNAKRLRTTQLIEDRVLPARDVVLVEADLRDPRRIDRLAQHIKPWFAGEKSFVLLEGLSYYLTSRSLKHLFETLRRIQTPGSILALDYWKPSVLDNPSFKRQLKFFSLHFGFSKRAYAYIEEATLQELEGYSAVELTDVVMVESRYSTCTCLGRPESTMPDEFAVLVRTE